MPSTLPILDKQSALDRIGGDEQLYDEVLELFLEDVPIQISKLDTAVVSLDRAVIERQVHSIKSAAANVGAEALRAICFDAEPVAQSAAQEALLDLVKQIHVEFRRVYNHCKI